MTVLNRFVQSPSFLSAVLAGFFCFAAGAAPTVTSFSPAFGSSTDPTPITITGNGFFPGAVIVKFNGVQSPSAGAIDANTIQATIPAGAPLGSGPIFVSVGGVSTLSQNDFAVIGSGPYVTGFTPNSGGAGADITINGAHFTTGMTIRFNGVGTVTNAASANTFNVKVPANASSGLISVSNSLGVSTSVSNFFVLPFITGFSPTNGRMGTNVLISGTNFLGTTSVQFSNVNATSFTVINNNSIQATAPTGVLSGLIRVSAPAGTVFSTTRFVVPPTVIGFTPTFGPIGTSVTVTGANFNIGTPTVKFGGVTAATPTGVTFNQLTVAVPSGATSAPISVITADGTGVSPGLFYLPPRITSFTPTNSAPGSTVTIIGTNFTDASAVSFNGTSAAFTVTNNNVIGAIVPTNFTTGPISITTPAGTSNTMSLAASNFYAAPIISNFSPLHGLPGTNVTITGSSFLGTLAVKFQAASGGTTNGTIVSVNNSQIVVRVPTNAITGPITVVAPAGTNTSASSFILDYADLLVTVGDDPDPVTVGSNLVYTILVKNFGPFPASVTLTNVMPTNLTFVSSTAGTTVGNVTAANLGTIAVNSSVFVTITGTANSTGIITNHTTSVTGPIATLVDTTTEVNAAGLPPPVLAVSFNLPNVVLSWPSASSNFTLQFNANLATTNWANVLTAPVSSGGTNTVTQTNLGAGMFYRLKK